MLTLRKVAITGPISSGKSTVCEFLEHLGACVIRTDEIVHKLLTTDKHLQDQVSALLNAKISFTTPAYREQIADLVFENEVMLKKLEKLLHPRVLQTLNEEFEEKNKEGHCPLFVCEVPLLFEKKWEGFFDKTVYVSASPWLCEARFTSQKKRSASDWKRRMNYFDPQAVSEKKATYVLTNNGSLSELKKNVENLYSNLIQP